MVDDRHVSELDGAAQVPRRYEPTAVVVPGLALLGAVLLRPSHARAAASAKPRKTIGVLALVVALAAFVLRRLAVDTPAEAESAAPPLDDFVVQDEASDEPAAVAEPVVEAVEPASSDDPWGLRGAREAGRLAAHVETPLVADTLSPAEPAELDHAEDDTDAVHVASAALGELEQHLEIVVDNHANDDVAESGADPDEPSADALPATEQPGEPDEADSSEDVVARVGMYSPSLGIDA